MEKTFITKEMQKLLKKVFVLCTLSFAACSSFAPLDVVPSVDLNRYAGKWYEIARLPFFIQEGCVGTTAEYQIMDNNEVKVTNSCFDKSFSGEKKVAVGKAWSVDPQTNAKLKVQFFWPFRGDYWIIELDKNYDYAVVGQPSRKYLWILCRNPDMDEKLYQDILERMTEKGFDMTKIIRTKQW